MYRFVICNAYKKYSYLTPSYMYDYEIEISNPHNKKISLSNLIKSESTFLQEYFGILSLLGLKNIVDEQYVISFYKSWKTTIPPNDNSSVEDYLFKGCK